MMPGSFMNHFGLFLPTLLGQASAEQQAEWLTRAFTLKIIGAYGQTELGHGSNVRGLQTTAHYDAKTQEFIINTPTLQSIKWWPGTMGKLATHVLVYAQLILNNKEYGVHIFMVQVRDENHRPLPGIELGDVGPKMGDHANDTSFLRLDSVRVPREHMLNKFQQVTEDGTYVKSTKKTSSKMHYATMMQARGHMVKLAGGKLAQAVTIATRYSCVRTQGFSNTAPDASFRSEEVQIIDYSVQRYRILKQLALSYAMKFTGRYMINLIETLDTEGTGVITDVNALAEAAATSAGLKAYVTYAALEGMEDVRKCCGGNGYLLNSGVAQLEADYTWQTTAEGDGIVMMLQTARFLMKMVKKARDGAAVAGPCIYLAPLRDKSFNVRNVAPRPPTSSDSFKDLNYLVSLFQHRALVSVVSVSEQLNKRLAAGESFDSAWNSLAVQLVNAGRAHCANFVLDRFVREVQSTTEPSIQRVLAQVCAFYAVSVIMDENWVRAGVFDAEHMKLLDEAVTELMNELRPNAVALTDAFDIPDRVLASAIGRYDGNVYEALFEAAKRSQLNQTDPFFGYTDVVRRHLDLPFLKLRNKLAIGVDLDCDAEVDIDTGSGGGDVSLQADTVFAELTKRLTPDMVKKVGVVYRFDISANDVKKSWLVDLKNGAGGITVIEGGATPAAAPDCTIIMSDDDFLALMTGKLQPMPAFMQGKIKVKGNLMASQKLSALVGQQSKL